MLWQTKPRPRGGRRLPAGFIVPCAPVLVDRPPAGPDWIHEIKHDGFRVIARKEGEKVCIWTRHGSNYTARFTRIAEAVRALPFDEVTVDGEAMCATDEGRPDFEALLTVGGCRRAFMYAYDLLCLEGTDWRPKPLEDRREQLREICCVSAIEFSESLEHDGETVFRHACNMGLEGIVSKRKGSRYRSGKDRNWMKAKCRGYRRG